MKLGAALALGLVLCAGAALAEPRSVFIEDLTWPEVKAAIEAGKTTAIYYAGSTEQNGPHMALGKHNFVARHVAQRIAEQLGNALVYPVLPFAPTGNAAKPSLHMRFAGSVTLSEGTFGAVAREVSLSAATAGFKNIALMGDHGGGQETLARVAAELSAQLAPRGVRVHYIGDLYYKSFTQVRAYLRAHGLPPGDHASIEDTSELMFVDKEGRWIRKDRLAPGSEASGVEGDPRQASAQAGKIFIDFKIDAAVAQIRRLTDERRR